MEIKKLQPYKKPHIPPISFFRPISVNFEDNMTDVEYLLGILKKLNEVVLTVNEIINSITGYDEKIAELEEKLDTSLEEIEREFLEFKAEVETLVASNLLQSKAYTDTVASGLQNQIDNIVVGSIKIYDPTTGILSPLQTVINNLYSQSRESALTAKEYDDLELNAQTYDLLELTARDYDTNAKNLITV